MERWEEYTVELFRQSNVDITGLRKIKQVKTHTKSILFGYQGK